MVKKEIFFAGGRLPVTWYPQEFTKVPMTDMRMRADPATGYPGRTYKFYTGEAVFKFGYGLSYSTHSYEFASTTQTALYVNKTVRLQAMEDSKQTISYDISNLGSKRCQKLDFSTTVIVSNHGPMAGRHSVLLFLRRPNVHGGRPMKQLVGFESVQLAAGESAHVEFPLRPCEHLSRIGEDGRRLLDEGSHFLVVGDTEHEFSVMG